MLRLCQTSGLMLTVVISSMQWGAQVVSASFGSNAFVQSTYDALARLRDAGILFVAAAGNGASDLRLMIAGCQLWSAHWVPCPVPPASPWSLQRCCPADGENQNSLSATSR